MTRKAAVTTPTETPRPEVHAALALAERHRRTAEDWRWRPDWLRPKRRLIAKHQSKAQKHLMRAARYAGATS